jgi:hypothetical protein
MTDLPDPGAFGAAFEDFMRTMSAAAEHGGSDVVRQLREHLGAPTDGGPFPAMVHALTAAGLPMPPPASGPR